MYNEKIEFLIKAALADGVLTEKEKQVLFRRAQEQGIDLDEFEMVLDAKLVELKKSRQTAAPKSEKFGNVRKCPSCGAIISAGMAACQECGFEFSGIEANQSSKLLADKIAKIEEDYNRKIDSANNNNDHGDRKWEINKEKYCLIAQIIKGFPVPNTKADLFEFIINMQSRMLSQMEYKVVAEAYATKYNESMTKAKTLYSKDPIFSKHFEEQTKIITEYQKVRRKQKGFGLKTRHKAFLAAIIFLIVDILFLIFAI